MACDLEASIWIRRLPMPQRRQIVKACRLLQQQADLLQASAQSRR
jgi:hypothetical protein